jgi:hypothetical protein
MVVDQRKDCSNDQAHHELILREGEKTQSCSAGNRPGRTSAALRARRAAGAADAASITHASASDARGGFEARVPLSSAVLCRADFSAAPLSIRYVRRSAAPRHSLTSSLSPGCPAPRLFPRRSAIRNHSMPRLSPHHGIRHTILWPRPSATATVMDGRGKSAAELCWEFDWESCFSGSLSAFFSMF